MLEWLDAECEAALARVMRAADRVQHFEARSQGQKRRQALLRVTKTVQPEHFHVSLHTSQIEGLRGVSGAEYARNGRVIEWPSVTIRLGERG